MSAMRAAMRREKRQREKAKSQPNQRGKTDGRELSVYISILYLHSIDKKWNADKCIGLIDKCNKEAIRFDRDGVAFVLDFYEDKISKKLKELDNGTVRKVNTVNEKIYNEIRDGFFIAGFAVVCTVLSSEYGYATNNKETGRLDKVIISVVKEYINILNNKTIIDDYKNQILREIGINFRGGV